MNPGAIPPNEPRRPRRYAVADLADDTLVLLLFVIVFLLMIAVGGLLLGLWG